MLDEHGICRGTVSRFLLRVTHSYLADMRRKSLLITPTTSISWVDLTSRSYFAAILLAQHSVLVNNLSNDEESMYCDLFYHINGKVLVNYLWFWREPVKLGELLQQSIDRQLAFSNCVLSFVKQSGKCCNYRLNNYSISRESRMLDLKAYP